MRSSCSRGQIAPVRRRALSKAVRLSAVPSYSSASEMPASSTARGSSSIAALGVGPTGEDVKQVTRVRGAARIDVVANRQASSRLEATAR
jgi:hypothetical protein